MDENRGAEVYIRDVMNAAWIAAKTSNANLPVGCSVDLPVRAVLGT
jgi:hypothetical protein